MKKLFYLFYATVCYLVFFGTFLYMIGFVENAPVFDFAQPIAYLFPVTLDFGLGALPAAWAIPIDLGLIALFGLQHSVMARRGFKERWTQIIPWPIERSTYVLLTSVCLILLYVFWQPISGVVWDFRSTGLGFVFLALSLVGWVLLLISTFLINHFELFGLLQPYQFARYDLIKNLQFRITAFYKFVRHPIYFSFLLAFWFAPLMTVGHLIFTVGMTTYIFIGIYHEERDLVATFGEQYLDYRKRVHKIIPFLKR